MVLINLKCTTVTWLFKMAKFMWVIFNCPDVDLNTPTLRSEGHELHEFAI